MSDESYKELRKKHLKENQEVWDRNSYPELCGMMEQHIRWMRWIMKDTAEKMRERNMPGWMIDRLTDEVELTAYVTTEPQSRKDLFRKINELKKEKAA